MKVFSVVMIGVLLGTSGRLAAQTSDPTGAEANPGSDPFADPFGPFGAERNPSRRAIPVDSEPVQPIETPLPNRQATPPVFPSFTIDGQTSASRARIENALNAETVFDYLDQPLKDVIDDIAYNHNIPIAIDTRALDTWGVDTGTPVTCSMKGISLRSALRLMLRELDLAIVIRDEVLQITSEESAVTSPVTRFYPVADVLPPNGDGKILVEIIKAVVAPKTWSDSGGEGAIVYVEHIETIVVRQTDEVFHAIDQLLAATKQQLAGKQNPKARPDKTGSSE